MSHSIRILSLIVLALALAACGAANRTRTDLPAGPVPDAGGPAVLYARDGSVVQAGGQAGAPGNGPAATRLPQEGSRTFMLELYQRAIDEKEALALEIKNLEATLAKSRSELAAALKQREALEREHAALESERARLQEENFDLAGRLVTAQVRRLESEKILLESKIEWQRLEERNAPEKAKTVVEKAEKTEKKDN